MSQLIKIDRDYAQLIKSVSERFKTTIKRFYVLYSPYASIHLHFEGELFKLYPAELDHSQVLRISKELER